MCARLTVLSDTPIPSAIAGCVIPISRHSTIWMRSRCAGGNFQCRAVFSRRTSALLHLIICPPNQMVGSESCRARKKYCTNHTHPLSPQKSRFERVWRRYHSPLQQSSGPPQQWAPSISRAHLLNALGAEPVEHLEDGSRLKLRIVRFDADDVTIARGAL